MIPVLLPPTLTLDLRATSLTKALPVLAKGYGVAMRAAPAIGGEIVVLSLKEAKFPALRERLAVAFAGEWTTDRDGTLVFGSDAKARRGEERAALARRIAGAEAGLARLRGAAKEARPFTPEAARETRRAVRSLEEEDSAGIKVGGVSLAVPDRRVFEQIAGRFRAGDLGIGLGGTRAVFSTRPTAMQRPFPFDPAPMLAQWAREETVWRESDPEGTERTPAPPALLTLVARADGESLDLELAGYDSRGEAVLSTDDRVSLEPERAEPPADDPRLMTKVRIEFSPESLLYARAFDTSLVRRPLGAGTAAFLDPVGRDPLSYEMTDLLLPIAAATGRSLVAAPEDAPPGLPAMLPELLKEASLGLYGPLLDLRTPGWAVFRPESPALARRSFHDRAALARGLRMAFATDRPDVPELAAIAATVPTGDGSGTDLPLTSLPTSLVRGYGLSNWPMLALFHAAGPGAFATGGVRFGDLPPELRGRAARLAFGAAYADGFESKGSEAEREITTAWPGGVPPDARLMDRAVESVILSIEAKDGGEPRETSPGALARIVRRARLGKRGEGDERLDLNRIRLLDRRIHQLGIFSGEGTGVSVTVVTFGTPGKEVYTLATLPPEIRAKFDAALKALEERGSEPAGGGEPPP